MKSAITLPIQSEYFWDSSLESNLEVSALTAKVWPNYLIKKSDIDEPQEPTQLSDDELSKRFLLWGIRRKSDLKLVAFASAVLISIDEASDSYSNDGWRYALKAYYQNGIVNCFCLLSANIDPDFRNFRFSYSLVEAAKEIAKSLNLCCVIAPVRPTQKSQFPHMPISEYLEKKTSNGEIYDPWLRTHKNLGGEILNVCSNSVLVKASLNKWREWLDLEELSSETVPDMGLVPLSVDLKENVAIYSEPNVWVRYKISRE